MTCFVHKKKPLENHSLALKLFFYLKLIQIRRRKHKTCFKTNIKATTIVLTK